MGRKLLAWLLAAAIVLAMPVVALGEVQEKSWDVNNEHIYGIVASNDGNLSVTDDPLNNEFSGAYLLSADKNYPDGMKGDWSIKKLSGDDIEVELLNDRDPSTNFALNKGEAGQIATFLITFSSDDLQNDVCKHITVTVVAKDNEYANQYVYDKTEHEVKTGKRHTVKAGHTLPAGAELYRDITFDWVCDDAIFENGWFNINESTGEFAFCIRRAGVYNVTIWATLMDNVVSEIKHTITVSGPDTDEDLPDEFDMWVDNDDIVRRYTEDDENFVTNYHLNDEWAWRNDEIKWEVVQTKGENVEAFLRNFGDSNCEGELMVAGSFPVGEYEFEITATNVTRGESVSEKVKVAVEDDRPGEVLPEKIEYKKIKQDAVITLKTGKTLSFGKPTLYPANATLPDNYVYGLWIEDYEGNWDDMCVKEDATTGAHILRGAKEGTYTVHAFLDMYDRSRGAQDVVFTLKVESAGAKVNSISFNKSGDFEKPFQIIVGKPTKIKATVLPKNAKVKTLNWYSDWSEGASVDQKGVVTGHMVGE